MNLCLRQPYSLTHCFAMCFQAEGVQQKSEGSPSPPAVSPPVQAGNGAKENGIKENSSAPVPSLGEGPRDSQGLDKRIPGASKCKLGIFSPYVLLLKKRNLKRNNILCILAFTYLSQNSTWIGHSPQETELKFDLEWQEEECIKLQFKECNWLTQMKCRLLKPLNKFIK